MTILGTFSFCLGPPWRGDLATIVQNLLFAKKEKERKKKKKKREDTGEPPSFPRDKQCRIVGEVLTRPHHPFTKGQTSCKP